MTLTRLRQLSLVGKAWVAVAFSFALLHAGSAHAQGPTINFLVPSSISAGGVAFTLTVSGSGFNTNSVVHWHGSPRTTTFFSSITLEASITATDIAVPGDFNITVVNPGPVVSNAVVFTVLANVPTITSIDPTSVTAGGSAFTLTVNGTGFTASSKVRWNGDERSTTYVNSTRLTAAIPASDIATSGTATITVTDPASGGTASNSATISILALILYFPQIAVGGGNSTVLTVFNTANQTALCNLVLTDQNGSPFFANITPATVGPLAPLELEEAVNNYTLAFYLSPGAMKVITLNPVSPNDPVTKRGWAKIDYQGGSSYGVATFKYRPTGALASSVGILSTQPVSYATIPVDNDSSQGRYTGFAVANHNSSVSVSIRLLTLNQSGELIDNVVPPTLNSLGPGRQVSVFLHELLPRSTFKGTMILFVLEGKQVIMTALVLEQGVLSAIPVVPNKLPTVP